MGCGISRDHCHNRGSTTESSVKEDRFTKNNGKEYGGNDFRRGVSSSLSPIHAKHIPPPTTTSSLALVHDIHGRQLRRKIYIQGSETGDRKDAEAKSSISIQYDDHQNYGKRSYKEEEDDERIFIPKFGDNNAAGPLFIGSPSFRDYCVVDCCSGDTNNLNSDIGNKHMSKEGEKTMPSMLDNVNEVQGSSGTTAAALKKTRHRRSKKDSCSRPIHRLAALGTLINLPSCYHPNNK